MRGAWWVVFRKETRETLRDRRTLFMMVVVPVLLYPALLVASEQLLLFGQRRLEAEPAPVAVVGPAPSELMSFLEARGGIALVEVAESPEDALRAEDVAAVALMGDRSAADGTQAVTLLYDAASDRSQRARSELDRALADWRDTLVARRLAERGLAPTFATPLAVSDSSIARPDEIGGYTVGRILPLLLVVITLLGAFYPAIDLAAGEKERGTLEALLTAPVPARAIVAGKFVTVALMGVTAAALNLGSMLLTFQTGLLQVSEAIGIEIALPWWSVAVIFAALVPLAVLFGAVFLGIAVRASSFKEAQSALTPVYVLVLVPAMIPVFPGIELGPATAVLPVAGVSFLCRDLMTGDATWLLAALVLSSTSLYALLGLAFAARAFGSERVLFGSGEAARATRDGWRERFRAGGRTGAVPEPTVALGFVAALAVLFFYGGIRLQVSFGEAGLVASEWSLLFAPTALFLVLGRYDLRATLSLRAPAAGDALAGTLLVAGALPLVWLIGWLQSFVLPIPWDLLEGLEELVTADSLARFVWLLVALALTPALCEEIVFRGVLLGSTRRLGPWRMIALNGFVFGAFHLSFETVIRFVPTATLGMLIAWAVWRSGSIWVGALMHFTNNAAIVLITSVPLLRGALSDSDAPPPAWLVLAGAALLVLGARLFRKEGAA